MSLNETLQRAINPRFDSLLRLPIWECLTDGTISRCQYLVLLHQLLQIQLRMDEALEQQSPLLGLFDPSMCRAEAIARDLALLGAAPSIELLPPTEALNRTIRRASRDPAALVGCLYVFEALRLHSRSCIEPLAVALHVGTIKAGRGLDYHLEAAQGSDAHWTRFNEHLDACGLTSQEPILEAAVATINALFDLYATMCSDSVEALCA